MATKKEITDEGLADLLDHDIPISQIAALCHTTEAKIQARINNLESPVDPTVIAEYEAEKKQAEDAELDRLTFHKISHPNARAFLVNFAMNGTVTAAARVARVDRHTHYDWLKNLDGYADAFEQAQGMFADSLEESARRRARDGVEKPIYQGGFLVGSVREYSDTLMLALLKAKKPNEYKDRSETRDYDMGQFDDEELDRIASGEAIERVLASSRRRRTGEATAATAPAHEPAAADLDASAGATNSGDGVGR